jgi:hypothetical protein
VTFASLCDVFFQHTSDCENDLCISSSVIKITNLTAHIDQEGLRLPISSSSPKPNKSFRIVQVKQLAQTNHRIQTPLLVSKLLAHREMKRGAPDSPAPARANSYAGSGVSADVKEHTARLAVALQTQGVAVETIMKALADTAYAPKRRTLMRHMAAIKDRRNFSTTPSNSAFCLRTLSFHRL